MKAIVVVAFLSYSDDIVLENLVKNFINVVLLPEARFFYSFQVRQIVIPLCFGGRMWWVGLGSAARCRPVTVEAVCFEREGSTWIVRLARCTVKCTPAKKDWGKCIILYGTANVCIFENGPRA